MSRSAVARGSRWWIWVRGNLVVCIQSEGKWCIVGSRSWKRRSHVVGMVSTSKPPEVPSMPIRPAVPITSDPVWYTDTSSVVSDNGVLTGDPMNWPVAQLYLVQSVTIGQRSCTDSGSYRQLAEGVPGRASFT